MSRDWVWDSSDSMPSPPGADHATPDQTLALGSWWIELRTVLLSRTFVFLGCLAASFLIFFFRNPDPYINPAFYTEDGTCYVGPIYCEGFWSALHNARPDYFVFGNVFLTWLGVQICQLFFDGNIFQLPRILAIISYLYFALVISLPVLLMRRRLRLPFLLALWLASAFIPLGTHDNEVLGRISNIGFALFYVAFVLVWYRNQAGKPLWATPLTDLGLLGCVVTNPLCFALLPFTGVPYLKQWVWERRPFAAIVRQKSFASLLVLGACCIPLVMRIYLNERPDPTKPLAEYTASQAIEMILGRNLLYPLVHSVYSNLNSDRTVALFLLACYSFYRFGGRKNRDLYLMGGLSLAATSYVLLFQRTELMDYTVGYTLSFPDRYYYGQNLIVLLLLTVLASDLVANSHVSRWIKVVPVILLACYFHGGCQQSSYGRPFVQLDSIGNFEDNVRSAFENGRFVDREGHETPDGDYIKIQTYPVIPDLPGSWTMILPRSVLEVALNRR